MFRWTSTGTCGSCANWTSSTQVSLADREKKRELDLKQDAYIANKRDKKGNESLLAEIKALQSECLNLSNEKVTISRQTEQIVRESL